MSLSKLNPVEPPWYGPVCPVVWEGWYREVFPYPDLGWEGDSRPRPSHLFDSDNQFAEAAEDVVQRALLLLDMEARISSCSWNPRVRRWIVSFRSTP